jgi:two-component system chemotaxis sensor kinase CheA
MIDSEISTFCILVDQIIGEQQVVVKPSRIYSEARGKPHGISGCTILGDGKISLILNVNSFQTAQNI